MLGTLINVGAILLGGVVGCLLGNQFPEHLKRTVIAGLGLFTFALGVQMFLKTQNTLFVLGGLLTGVICGELIHIEDGLQNFGVWLESRLLKSHSDNEDAKESPFVRGFLTASLVFCVGPMAILGSIQNGLTGDASLLIVKSVLDGFAALAFASSLGVGVLFSSLMILVYQGSISLLAQQAQAIISTDMMTEMTAVGGILLMAIALSSLLEIKKMRVGNFLPALLFTPIIVAIVALFK